MKRTLWVAILIAGGLAGILAAQTLDEAQIVRNRDWQGMLALAQQAAMGNGPFPDDRPNLGVARSRRAQAWEFAYNRAVYDPAKDGSGADRAGGMRGLVAVLRATDAGDPNLPDRQLNLEKLQPPNIPQVFSGGPNNEGLWLDPERFDMYLFKQNGGAIMATGQPRPDAPWPPGQFQKLEGREFRDRTMVATISEGNATMTMTWRGTLTLRPDGNTLEGQLRSDTGAVRNTQFIRWWKGHQR